MIPKIIMVAHYQVLGEGGLMPLFDIFSNIKADISTAIACRKMIKAEQQMHKDVTAKDYKMLFDIMQYHNETGCDWEAAIEKFTSENQT